MIPAEPRAQEIPSRENEWNDSADWINPANDSPIPDPGDAHVVIQTTRNEIDRINTIIESEMHCRGALDDCNDLYQSARDSQGWQPWVVITVGVVVALLSAGAGLGIGYAVAR